jgi:hypothetical protein
LLEELVYHIFEHGICKGRVHVPEFSGTPHKGQANVAPRSILSVLLIEAHGGIPPY